MCSCIDVAHLSGLSCALKQVEGKDGHVQLSNNVAAIFGAPCSQHSSALTLACIVASRSSTAAASAEVDGRSRPIGPLRPPCCSSAASPKRPRKERC